MPSNVLFFVVLRQSATSAERLNFQVWNGIGHKPFAITTKHVYLPSLASEIDTII